MKAFRCACGARVFFENTSCLTCGKELGFVPEDGAMGSLEPVDDSTYRVHAVPGATYRKCENYVVEGACNWMVRSDDDGALCQACRLNHVIPDLTDPENRAMWLRVEGAKRRLVYTLDRLALPVVPKSADAAGGLEFDIKASDGGTHVMTGHADGLITLNLAEADPVLREKTRLEMNERYRTLLGHFRHEVGHYYWDVLIKDGPELDGFRALFGDEREDYEAALRRHYEEGGGDWSTDFVSGYARAHPWEDWAETWAHYLHMVDTLETAVALGFAPAPAHAAVVATPFARLFSQWMELAVVLNELNRSMGLDDAYPFQLGDGARKKLAFVHDVVGRRREAAQAAPSGAPASDAARVEPRQAAGA